MSSLLITVERISPKTFLLGLDYSLWKTFNTPYVKTYTVLETFEVLGKLVVMDVEEDVYGGVCYTIEAEEKSIKKLLKVLRCLFKDGVDRVNVYEERYLKNF